MNYSYLPDKPYKELWKFMLSFQSTSSTGAMPSIGIISQAYQTDKDILHIVGQIKRVGVLDKHDFLNQFSLFLNRCFFIEFTTNSVDLFNQGKKEEAFEAAFEFTKKFNSFQVKETFYQSVFKGYEERQRERNLKQHEEEMGSERRVIFGIDEMDAKCGLLKPGDSILFLAQSGKGKSQFLKHLAITNARRGCRVAHFQLEGTKEECTTAYDSSWTGALYQNIESNILTTEQIENFTNISRKVEGDIYIDVAEQFNSISMKDLDDRVGEMIKLYGDIDLIIIDYLEKAQPGDGRKYAATSDGERMRREAVGDKIKNIGVKYNAVTATATQANNISKDKLNNPEFTLTREHIADFKALINSFSFFFTHNMTDEEYDNNFARIYIDKLRKRKSNFVVRIATNYARSRYYDRKKTLQIFGDAD